MFAFVVLHQLAEQVDSRAAERVGDGVGELRHPLRVDVLDGGQFGLGERLPRRLLDRLEQVALARGDEQQRGPRPTGPAGAPDAVHVGLGVMRDIVVQDVRDAFDVKASGRDVGGDEDVDAFGAAVFERGDGPLALRLRQFAVDGGRENPRP